MQVSKSILVLKTKVAKGIHNMTAIYYIYIILASPYQNIKRQFKWEKIVHKILIFTLYLYLINTPINVKSKETNQADMRN